MKCSGSKNLSNHSQILYSRKINSKEEYCEYQKASGDQIALAVRKFPLGIKPSPVSERKPHECGN